KTWAIRKIEHELAAQCAIQRVKRAGGAPFVGQQIHNRRGSHDFMIQLETSRTKRAATAVRPPLYCSATTQASVSNEPSAFCSRSLSANSSGRLEAKSTSWGVPNSIIVLSESGGPLETRVSRTGRRIGVALGKNLASLVVDSSRVEVAKAVADVNTVRLSWGSTWSGLPSLPVSMARAP